MVKFAKSFRWGAALFCLLPFLSAPAVAGYEKTSHVVYMDWPELSVEPLPGGAEYEVMAIVETEGENNPVIYVINYNYKGRIFVLGAFECGHKFEVLSSVTNGQYDILCAQKNIFGEITETILKAMESGAYEQQF